MLDEESFEVNELFPGTGETRNACMMRSGVINSG